MGQHICTAYPTDLCRCSIFLRVRAVSFRLAVPADVRFSVAAPLRHEPDEYGGLPGESVDCARKGRDSDVSASLSVAALT